MFENTEMTIEEFFGLVDRDGGRYQIETPAGWQDVNSLVKKNKKECYNLVLENGVELGCSSDHFVMTTTGWTKAEDLDVENSIVLTKDGQHQLVAKEFIGENDTFDLQVNHEDHSYYSNGIVSHNTGKSMICDALAAYYEMPLLRLDMGAIFSSLVGDSEQNMRNIIKVVDSVAPAVLWIDEIEKGIGGVQSSNATDGGVSNRVFGTLLTWMQEKTAPVFVVCTANSVVDIPPEFMRAGRVDEIFFVDLPDAEQRYEVIECLIRRKSRDPKNFAINKIVAESENYSPAEIEKGINGALFCAFSDGRRELATEDIVSELSKFQPLYNSRREEIEYMREWALGKNGSGGRAVLANAKVSAPISKDFTIKADALSINFGISEEEV